MDRRGSRPEERQAHRLKYYYVREMVVKKAVIVIYTPSADNRADALTKVLIGQSLQFHQGHLGVYKVKST